MNYMFSNTYTANPGQVEICAWTDYPVDMQHNNDTACITTTIVADVAIFNHETKKILQVHDLLGRNSSKNKNRVLFYYFDDGTVQKRVIID